MRAKAEPRLCALLRGCAEEEDALRQQPTRSGAESAFAARVRLLCRAVAAAGDPSSSSLALECERRIARLSVQCEESSAGAPRTFLGGRFAEKGLSERVQETTVALTDASWTEHRGNWLRASEAAARRFDAQPIPLSVRAPSPQQTQQQRRKPAAVVVAATTAQQQLPPPPLKPRAIGGAADRFDPAASLLATLRADETSRRQAASSSAQQQPMDCRDDDDYGCAPQQPARKLDFISAAEKLAQEQQRKFGRPSSASASSSSGNHGKTLGGKRKFNAPRPYGDDSQQPTGPQQHPPPGKRRQQDGNSEPAKKPKDKDEDSSEITDINGVPLDDPRLRNVEPYLLERVQKDILDSSPVTTWRDIAGLEFAKKCVQEAVVWPMLRPDIFSGLRGPPKGLLLFGPPGTGKTMIGKAIASESRSTFFNISASALTSKWIGEGEKTVRALFAVARCYPRSVIFIDEIDSILTQRSETENEASRRLKTEFLVQLDGAGVGDEEHILVVGATNRPQELDEAARRRLVKRLYIALPESPARVFLLHHLLGTVMHSLSDADFEHLSEKTAGYSGSDIKALCSDAALGPIRELNEAGMDISKVDMTSVRPVAMCDFLAALSHVRASVSEADLAQYIEWNKQFGSFPLPASSSSPSLK